MPKTIFKLERRKSSEIRKKIKFFYTEKYFNKWMNKFIFVGLNYQQAHYLMKKLWGVGNCACSSISSSNETLAGLMKAGQLDMGSNTLIFTPWDPAQRFNIYDFSTHIRLINTRGVSFITNAELEVDKEAVIIYAQKNHKSVFSSIEAKIDELVDTHMTMRTALKAQKQPWMFTFSPEDRENAKILQEQIDEDAPYLFAPFNDPDKVKGFVSGANYIIDKLSQHCEKIDNEILTIIGVNNIGIEEKKEHLIVDEVNANNEDIKQQSVSYKNEIEDAFDRINACFSHKVYVIDLNELTNDVNQEDEQEQEDAQNDFNQ